MLLEEEDPPLVIPSHKPKKSKESKRSKKDKKKKKKKAKKEAARLQAASKVESQGSQARTGGLSSAIAHQSSQEVLIFDE